MKKKWIKSKRPHTYFPHIMVPCWILVEVDNDQSGNASE